MPSDPRSPWPADAPGRAGRLLAALLALALAPHAGAAEPPASLEARVAAESYADVRARFDAVREAVDTNIQRFGRFRDAVTTWRSATTKAAQDRGIAAADAVLDEVDDALLKTVLGKVLGEASVAQLEELEALTGVKLSDRVSLLDASGTLRRKVYDRMVGFSQRDRALRQAGVYDKLAALQRHLGRAGEHLDRAGELLEFVQLFDPGQVSEDQPWGSMAALGKVLGKVRDVVGPIPGLGHLVDFYIRATEEFSTALARLSKKLEEARDGALCGQAGRTLTLQAALRAHFPDRPCAGFFSFEVEDPDLAGALAPVRAWRDGDTDQVLLYQDADHHAGLTRFDAAALVAGLRGLARSPVEANRALASGPAFLALAMAAPAGRLEAEARAARAFFQQVALPDAARRYAPAAWLRVLEHVGAAEAGWVVGEGGQRFSPSRTSEDEWVGLALRRAAFRRQVEELAARWAAQDLGRLLVVSSDPARVPPVPTVRVGGEVRPVKDAPCREPATRELLLPAPPLQAVALEVEAEGFGPIRVTAEFGPLLRPARVVLESLEPPAPEPEPEATPPPEPPDAGTAARVAAAIATGRWEPMVALSEELDPRASFDDDEIQARRAARQALGKALGELKMARQVWLMGWKDYLRRWEPFEWAAYRNATRPLEALREARSDGCVQAGGARDACAHEASEWYAGCEGPLRDERQRHLAAGKAAARAMQERAEALESGGMSFRSFFTRVEELERSTGLPFPYPKVPVVRGTYRSPCLDEGPPQATPAASPPPPPVAAPPPPSAEEPDLRLAGAPAEARYGEALALAVQGLPAGSLQVVWSSDRGLVFDPPSGAGPRATTRLDAPGPVRLWAEVRRVEGEATRLLGETPQVEVRVLPPALAIAFAPTEGGGRVGAEVRAAVTATPALGPEQVVYRWLEPPSAARLELDPAASRIAFRPAGVEPVRLEAVALVPGTGEELGRARASYAALPYQLEVRTRGASTAGKGAGARWQVGEAIPVEASFRGPAPELSLRWRWEAAPGTSLGAAGGPATTLTRSEPGTAAAEVTASDPEGVVLARARATVPVEGDPAISATRVETWKVEVTGTAGLLELTRPAKGQPRARLALPAEQASTDAALPWEDLDQLRWEPDALDLEFRRPATGQRFHAQRQGDALTGTIEGGAGGRWSGTRQGPR